MSISLLLVPVAIAAISAFKIGHTETDAQGKRMCQVQTRMRDAGLLVAALADTNATVSPAGETITADWLGVQAVFHRDEQGIWQVDFTGDIDEKRAAEIVAAVDSAYGRQVQQAVLARLREKAPSAGMTVASETVEDDDSVTLVLNVEGTK